MNRIVAWVVLVACVAGLLYWQGGGKKVRQDAAKVETAALESGNIRQVVAASGAVRPLITVEVGSQLSGQITEILADFNTPVQKDQVIAVIDAKTFESRVVQSKADLAVADAGITVQKANIDKAKANLRKNRLEYERAEQLRERGVLSESEFEIALATYESASADLTVAEAQLDNAQANREQRRALLESAEIDLERTRIRSPIDGVVIKRAVDKGQTVAASLASPVLFYIAKDLASIQIEANVDEADIGNVRQDNEVAFTVDAYPDSEFSGTVRQVRLAPNELNNVVTYTVIITAGNPGLKLLPGMTAMVEIITGSSDDVLRAPNDAVRFRPAPDSALAASAPAAGRGAPAWTGGPGRAGGIGDISQLKAQLGLDDRQAEMLGKAIEDILAEMRGRLREGEDREAARQALRQRMAGVFQSHLSEEQYRRYQQLQNQASRTRPGQLWVQGGDGAIRPVSVRFGIADDSHTQVISDELKAGDRVVTRIHAGGR